MRLSRSRSWPSVLILPILALFASAATPDEHGGLEIQTTRPGNCINAAKKGDTIQVQYKGVLQSTGDEFDSSYRPSRTAFKFILGYGMVIKGWDVGLEGMCLGEARRLTIPPQMGYGDRGAPPAIPPGAVLVFDTELVGINGVTEPTAVASVSSSLLEAGFGIATASPNAPSQTFSSPNPSGTVEATIEDLSDALLPPDLPVTPPPIPTETVPPRPSDLDAAQEQHDGDNGECKLLGPFALFIQAALGGLAILSLVYKRWRETPRRPLLIWFFDVSKQVFGSVLLHVMNVFFSMLSGGDFDVSRAVTPATVSMIRRNDGSGQGETLAKDQPNPCSFYLLNLAIDTTIGIPVLVLLLKIFHGLFLHTPLARPPESLRSGNYGHPPSWRWYLKQSLIYYIALFFMKLFVYFLLRILPWLTWVGDWALRWTEGDEGLQIAFSMLIFPLIMNCIQYWVIDSFIKDPAGGSGDWQGHERVPQDDDEHADRSESEGGDDDDAELDSEGEDVKGARKILKEANPTPVPTYTDPNDNNGGASGSSSRSPGTRKDERHNE